MEGGVVCALPVLAALRVLRGRRERRRVDHRGLLQVLVLAQVLVLVLAQVLVLVLALVLAQVLALALALVLALALAQAQITTSTTPTAPQHRVFSSTLTTPRSQNSSWARRYPVTFPFSCLPLMLSTVSCPFAAALRLPGRILRYRNHAEHRLSLDALALTPDCFLCCRN